MAKKKMRVTGLELETKDGKRVELTLAEAKELHEQLDELFGEKVRYVPGSPIYVRPWVHPSYWVTCSTSANSLTSKSESTGMQITYTNSRLTSSGAVSPN